MASKSTQAASSSFSPPQWTHDVFLSFRGKDTRNNFTAHLCTALFHRGIKAYMDDRELERGKPIEPTLWKAIEESRLSVIIFSRNYASSPWCLDELVKIIQWKKEMTRSHDVFPVFYDVDPSEVAEQTGNCGEAFDRHEQDFSENREKVQRWRDGLKEVANLAGWDVRNRNGPQIIKEIVEKILYVVKCTLPNISKDLVGIYSRVGAVNGL